MLRDREKNSMIWSVALNELDDQKRLFTDGPCTSPLTVEPWASTIPALTVVDVCCLGESVAYFVCFDIQAKEAFYWANVSHAILPFQLSFYSAEIFERSIEQDNVVNIKEE